MTEQQNLIPMAAGERLRQVRERRRRSIEAAARALKVPVDVVEAIEQDRLERFAPVYRRGYVSAYARYLGFDDAETAALLEQIDQPAPPVRAVFNTTVRPHYGDRWLRATSYILGSLLIGTLAWQLTHEAVRLSQGSGQQAPIAVVKEEDQSGPSSARGDEAGHVNASMSSLNELAVRRAEVAASAGGETAWGALNAPESMKAEAPLGEGEHRLQIDTSGDSWVEIFDATGAQLEMDLIRGGSQRQYRGMAPFRILFGRASAVKLYLDQQRVNFDHEISGNVLQMSLDPQSLETVRGNDPAGEG